MLILPEVVDETKWLDGQHSYADPEGEYIFVYIANPKDIRPVIRLLDEVFAGRK